MQAFRDLARQGLARSLRKLSAEDRLALALPAVCGSAMATHCTAAHLEEGQVLRLTLDSPEWMEPFLRLRELLQSDLERISGVSLAELHFEVAADRTGRRRGS